jgi:glycosyltransferase involved in cell wall biosynthesis
MPALLFDYVPVDHAARKAEAPAKTTIVGSAVFRTDVVRAALKHGTFDRYYFVERRNWAHARQGPRTLPPGFGDDPRIRIVGPRELPSLEQERELVLMTAGPNLFNLLPLRVLLQRPAWPLFGVAHSLNGETLSLPLISLLMDDYGDHDAIVCSTPAGRRVIELQLETLRAAIEARTGAVLQSAVQLPVIPLGLDDHALHATPRDDARATLDIASGSTAREREPVIVLYFGRFSALTKGDLSPLLLAFRDAHARHPEAELVLAGDDTQQQFASTLRERAAAIGLAACVRVIPNPSDSDKRAWLAAADIFVAISDNLQETFGISVAEAMAAGLPVVAADWNGYRDLVTHGESGFLVPTATPRLGVVVDILSSTGNWVGDHLIAQTTTIDVPGLTCYLAALIDNPGLRQQFGERARREATQRFAWAQVIGAYERLWRDSLARGAAPRARRGRVGGGVLTYAYQHVFGHYPTRWLEDDDRLTLDASHASFDRTALDWSGQGDTMFSAALLDGIVDRLRHGAHTQASLIRRLQDDGLGDAFTARAHIARLLKYGLIAATPNAAAATTAAPARPLSHEVRSTP